MSSIREKRMKSKLIIKDKEMSIHSKISYFFGIIAIIVQFYLGFSHINDLDAEGQLFGFLSILEGIFACVGVFGTDIVRGAGLRFYPKDEFRKITTTTLIVFAGSLGINILIQFISQIPLTIRDIEVALAIVFAAPAEELFFRGFLMNIIFKTADLIPEQKISKKTGIRFFGILFSNISFTIISVIFTSFMFALLHVNYYDDIRLMLVVFFGGMAYSIFYWKFRDITGCILAHFVLNLIAVGQFFFVFNL